MHPFETMHTPAAEVPPRLLVLRETVTRLVNPALFEKGGVWQHWAKLDLLRARYAVDAWPRGYTTAEGMSHAFRLRLLRHAQELLAPLADDEQCRRMRPRWGNTQLDVDTPWGGCLWVFAVQAVQELAWMHREMVEGFRFSGLPYAERSAGNDRDANPYAERCRHSSWDHGYMLGHAWYYRAEQMKAWVDARTAEARAMPDLVTAWARGVRRNRRRSCTA